MPKRNQEPLADREPIAIGRRDLLRGALLLVSPRTPSRGYHRETDEDLAREMEE